MNTSRLSLIDQTAQLHVLGLAAGHVLSRAARGRDAPADVRAVAADPTAFIHDLAADLAGRTYVPQTLAPRVLKSLGKTRVLRIPLLRDRVVETALIETLTPRIDPLLSPTSFAFRRGLSTKQAATAATALAGEVCEDGRAFALCADIADCFGAIPHDLVLAQLRVLGVEGDAVELVAALLKRMHGGGASGSDAVGIPQGAPLSPLLANVALDALDRRLETRGVRAIRFADDLLIVTETAQQAASAETVLSNEAAELGMSLKPEKIATMSFVDGFVFVGEQLPSNAQQAAPVDRGTVYVANPGSSVRVARGRVNVVKGKRILLDLPQARVGRIVTFGAVGVSSGMRQWALASGRDIVFLSARGKLLGVADATHTHHVARRVAQYDAMRQPEFASAMGRSMLRGKVANSRALLRRYAHAGAPDVMGEVIDDLRDAFVRLDTVGVRGLMGVEGNAARSYWRAWKSMVPEDLRFETRRRRPPTDPVNAALSLVSTLLTSEAAGALAAAGLDAGMGVLHRPRNARASLALDLIEEFRPMIVETVVLEMARRHMLNWGEVDRMPDGGVRFRGQTLKAVFRRYERRMTTRFTHLPSGTRCSYRRALHLQAQAIARCVRTGDPRYEATSWRV